MTADSVPGYICEQCGFTSDLTEAAAREAVAQIVIGSDEFARRLRAPDADLRARPTPETWSVLEYGCHLRDVLSVQRERVLLARRVDNPSLAPMGRDARVDHDGYLEQDPDDVARHLEDSARLLENVFRRLEPGDWDRTLQYNFPVPTVQTLRWVAIHTLHEVRHHLADVSRPPSDQFDDGISGR